MSTFSDIDLLDGPFPATIAVLTVAAGVFLLFGRTWKWLRTVVILVLIAVALTFLINWYEVHVDALSAYNLPMDTLVPIGGGVLALLLTIAHIIRGRWWKKLLAPIALIVVVLAAAMQVNSYYGAYLTVGDLIGSSSKEVKPLPNSALKKFGQPYPEFREGKAAVDVWKKPAGLPSQGSVYSVKIPGKLSKFKPRDGYVYLPPAYKAKTRLPLPVVVLITGQPGSPEQWLSAGVIQKTMDEYAARHNGLAPIVVMPDVNGSTQGNTVCMDSKIAKADTYLSKDIPAWIKENLSADPNPARWVIAGFSFGGTCALQMAALHPAVYPNAIVMSGEAEPAVFSDRAKTIQATFGGNAAAFDALTPLHVMARTHYKHSAVYFAAGAGDERFSGYMRTTSAAAKKAGMDVSVHSVPGVGHSWKVPANALGPALDWHSKRLGLSK